MIKGKFIKPKWVMPKWMEKYRNLIVNTGGNSIEDLKNFIIQLNKEQKENKRKGDN